MPAKEQCSTCGKQVSRTRTNAKTITCHDCRRKARVCGTRSKYDSGCRCQQCKDAKAASMRAYAARRKAEGRPLPRSEWRAYEEAQCECCGTTFTREKRNKRRYMRVFCSYLCRTYTLHGPQSCPLPKTHWVHIIGATCEWTPPKPQGPFTYTCGWCDTEGESDYPTTAYCSEPCKRRASRARRRAAEHGAPGTYTWGQVVGLWATFGKACAYCRQPTPLEDIQAEHVTALSRGGANNIGNILPSCMPCNADKRDLTLNEWKHDRARRNLPPVVTQWEPDDTRYTHLAPAVTLAA